MRKHRVIYPVVLFVVFCFFAASNGAFAKGAPAKARKIHRRAVAADAAKAGEAPCQAYVVTEGWTGKVLEEQNMHDKRAPASMAKLMLAAIVLEKIANGEIHLTDKVTTSGEASHMGGSRVYLKEGEVFTLEQMMQAVMVASANDAAYAVAEFVSGSVRDFVDLMNEKAKSLGMNDTEFSSVHGLPPGKSPRKEDLTSCYDMALLAREVLKHPKMVEWSSTKTGGFRDGKFIMNNHNKLLSRMPEVDGLKTGFYSSTGYNVTATAKKGDLRFIVAVMGSPTAGARDGLVVEKLKKCFADYTEANLAKKGEVVDKEIALPDGRYRKIKGVTAADVNIPCLRAKKKDITRVVSVPGAVSGEVKQGQKLGEMLFRLDNEVVGKVDVVSPAYVPKANLFTRLVRKTGLDI